MRGKAEGEHTNYKDGKALLNELDSCLIFCVDEDEDTDDFVLSCYGCQDDPLYVTKEELVKIGEELIRMGKIMITEPEKNKCRWRSLSQSLTTPKRS